MSTSGSAVWEWVAEVAGRCNPFLLSPQTPATIVDSVGRCWPSWRQRVLDNGDRQNLRNALSGEPKGGAPGSRRNKAIIGIYNQLHDSGELSVEPNRSPVV